MPLGGFPDADKGYSVRSLTGKPFPVKLPEGFPCKGERGKRMSSLLKPPLYGLCELCVAGEALQVPLVVL